VARARGFDQPGGRFSLCDIRLRHLYDRRELEHDLQHRARHHVDLVIFSRIAAAIHSEFPDVRSDSEDALYFLPFSASCGSLLNPKISTELSPPPLGRSIRIWMAPASWPSRLRSTRPVNFGSARRLGRFDSLLVPLIESNMIGMMRSAA